MIRRRHLIVFARRLVGGGLLFAGCTSTGGDPAASADVGARHAAPLEFRNALLPLTLSAPDSAGGQRGSFSGDSLVRLAIHPRRATDAEKRLCSALAAASRASTELPWRWPIDSAAPRLAVRLLTGGDVQGVRFIVPGVRAEYVFEGVTADGTRLVSLRWPVVADPSRRVPVGAPDSVVEAVLRPSVLAIDSTIAALRFTATPDTAWPAAAARGPLHSAYAVNDDRMLPVHRAALSPACPEATLAIPMIARADHTVKIPVAAGDVITADANVTAGTVRIHFDDATPSADAGAWQSVTNASMQATQSGQLTLRVRVQVVARQQAAHQLVLLRVQRSRPNTP